MTAPSPNPEPQAVLEWTPEGAPRSALFDDIYFQPGEGLAESRAVFLQGCGLPEAWRGRARFVVGELGFGSGLNLLALLDLWRREHEPGQRLHMFSVEAYPLRQTEAARALEAWPELQDLSQRLLASWPSAAPGMHRIDLPELDAVIDLAIGEAVPALLGWSGQADAWFLDGFSPAKNPQMWRDEVLALVAARSAPGARLATFTVAGAVRRGLAAQGFAVERLPGHGRKRQRLEARLPDEAPTSVSGPRHVAIVGAGVAGASLARAAAALGLTVTVVTGPAGASANPAALVTPSFDAGEGAAGRLSAQAFARAVDLYNQAGPGTVIARGAVQLEGAPRDKARFDTVARSTLFAPGDLERLAPAAAGAVLHEPEGAGGLSMPQALVVEPSAVTQAWLADAMLIEGQVAALEHFAGGWRLLAADGAALADADVVWIAAGPGSAALSGLPILSVRGQASWVDGVSPGIASAWGGYAVPTRTGLLFGATHDRHDEADDVRAGDNARNLQTLRLGRPRLAEAVAQAALQGRAGVRATTRDRAPLAGAVPGMPGVFVLTGLGGRGFTLAPLLAEHLAALTVQAPSPLPRDLAAAVDPGRASSRSPAAHSGPTS